MRILAIIILGGILLLVWSFVFAPKTESVFEEVAQVPVGQGQISERKQAVPTTTFLAPALPAQPPRVTGAVAENRQIVNSGSKEIKPRPSLFKNMNLKQIKAKEQIFLRQVLGLNEEEIALFNDFEKQYREQFKELLNTNPDLETLRAFQREKTKVIQELLGPERFAIYLKGREKQFQYIRGMAGGK